MSPAPSRAVTATIVACLAVLAAALLPWLRTGNARRSAFALVRSADALGFIDTPVRRTLIVSWYLLPFLTAAAWTAGALRRGRLVAGLGALVGSMSVAAGSMVMWWARPDLGPVAAVATGSAALASAVWLARDIGVSRARDADGAGDGGAVEGRRT